MADCFAFVACRSSGLLHFWQLIFINHNYRLPPAVLTVHDLLGTASGPGQLALIASHSGSNSNNIMQITSLGSGSSGLAKLKSN